MKLRRLVGPLVVLVVLGGVAFLGAFPTRTYLAQRQTMSESTARLQELTEQNELMQQQVDGLGTDAEVEQLAREQYGLARDHEEVYEVLPPPVEPVEVPNVWPFNKVSLGK